MKIAIIDASLFTYHHDHKLACELAHQGHEVHLFGRPLRNHEHNFDGPYYYVPFFYKYSERLYGVRLLRPLFLGLKGLEHTIGMLKLLLLTRKGNYSIVHLQWIPFPIIDHIVITLLRMNVPVVISVHDTLPYNGSPSSKLQVFGWVRAIISGSCVITHTIEGKKRLLQYGVLTGCISVIPTGPLVDCPPKLETLPAEDNVLQMLLFGAIKAYKGLDILLQAMLILKNRNIVVNLLVSGKPYMDMSHMYGFVEENDLSEQVNWDLRYIPEEEICTIFNSSDIFVFPYYHIDSSGVFSSVIGLGKPIIASSIGIFNELLTDRETGMLIPPGDAEAMATAIEMLVMDSNLRDKIGAEARRRVSPAITWEHITNETLVVYEMAIQKVGLTD